MVSALVLVVAGILFVLLPHFVLPMGYIKGGAGALLVTECALAYHPELYLGILIAAGGLLSLRFRLVRYGVVVLGLLGLIQAYILRPVSYYLLSEMPLVILSQTFSLRAHTHIRTVLTVLSIVVIATALLPHLRGGREHLRTMSWSRISVANITRRRYRSLALFSSVMIVLGVFFADVFLSQSIEKTLELGAGRLGADLMVVPRSEQKAAQAVLLSGGPTMFYMNRKVLEDIRAFPEIETLSPQLYVQPFSYKVCCIVESILIIGYDPETDFTVAPWIEYSLKNKQGLKDVVVGRFVKFYPGQSMQLFGQSLKVVASLEPTGLGYFDNSAFIPIEGAKKLLTELREREDVRRIPDRREILDESFSHLFPTEDERRLPISEVDPEGISAVFIKARSGVSVKELSRKIQKALPDVAVINIRESTLSVKRHLTSVLRAFMLPILVLLAMGTMILGIVFSMSVTERQREIGLLRAVGARRSDIFRIVLSESLIVTSIGGVFGILFGSALIFVFKNKIMESLKLLYIWPSPQVIAVVLTATAIAALAIGLLAGAYPALRAARMEPYHAIRSGEK